MKKLVGVLALALLSVPSLAEEAKTARALFAGGCFWCMEQPFDELEGVLSTTSGYAGGTLANPSYEQVSAGGSGHLESVQVIYDPTKLSYRQLLEVFWRNIDPLDGGGQFCDRGSQYSSAIFYLNDEQRMAAAESLRELVDSGRFDRVIQTQLRPKAVFYPAEQYHQDYYQRNPVRYKYYRWRCGRDQRLAQLWGRE